MDNNSYWFIALISTSAIFFIWYKFVKLPKIIRDSISKIPNFEMNKFHLGDGIGLAFDFSNRTFAYSNARKAYLFHAHELRDFRHHWAETPTNQGTINETRNHLRIRLANDTHPEIQAHFLTRSDAQKCENSFDRLLMEEIAFQESASIQRGNEITQNDLNAKSLNNKLPQLPAPYLTATNKGFEEQFIKYLKDKGFSNNNGKINITREMFNQATDLIFFHYESLFGLELKHNYQQRLEKALHPFFERQPGAPKNTGFTRGTIGKYLSENKTAWDGKRVKKQGISES